MQLRKHRFVPCITAFSLVITLFMHPGFLPETAVRAENLPDLHARRTALEAAETENAHRLAALQQEITTLQDRADELENAIREAPAGSLSVFRAYAACLGRLEEARQEEETLRRTLKMLRQEQNALESRAADLEEIYRETLAAACRNAGGAVWDPVWPVPGYSAVSCSFGEGGHRGVDLTGAGIYGAPIAAAAAGEVTWSGWMNSYGYCVFIDHGNGFSTRYAHASELNCNAGDRVSAGDTVAYVGSTGNSTGPHLHFEVLRGSTLQDPLQYYG